MRIQILLSVVILIVLDGYSQALNLDLYASICSESPRVNIQDGDDYSQMSGLTICPNCSVNFSYEQTVLTIQQNGNIRFFNTNDHANPEPLIGKINSSTNDFEGITFLFEEAGTYYYGACEEKTSSIHVFSVDNTNDVYNVDEDLNNGQPLILPFTVNNNLVPQGSANNKGLEGITYNPVTGKIYIVKEKGNPTLYESNDTYFNLSDFTSIQEIAVSALTISGLPSNFTDFAGLYHLNLEDGINDQNSILLLSQEGLSVCLINLDSNPVSVEESFSLSGIHSGAKIEGVILEDKVLMVCNDDDASTRSSDYSDFYTYVNKGNSSVKLGNVNCDNKVDVLDAKLMLEYLVGDNISADLNNCNLMQFNETIADVNFDGEVSTVDALLIAQHDTGIKHRFCPCKP